MTPQPIATRSSRQMIVAYFKDFGVLRETGTEYWGIQIVNFLDCTFYFAMLTIASVFLSEDLGLNDKQAGYSITLFTSATSLMLFVSGLCTDWLGIKKSLNLSMAAMLILRLAVVVVGLVPSLPHRGLLVSGLFLLMAPFMAAIQTVFQSSCQRFTTKRSRSAGFNLWYLFMNIGAAAAGFSIDIVRKLLHLPNVHIFTMGVVTALLCLVVGMTLVKREDQLVGPEEPPETKPDEAKVRHKPPWQAIREVIREPTLWRLLVLVALILGVRAVYAYMYLLMPKYWLRTIGEGAAFGTLNAINPIGIVIGLDPGHSHRQQTQRVLHARLWRDGFGLCPLPAGLAVAMVQRRYCPGTLFDGVGLHGRSYPRRSPLVTQALRIHCRHCSERTGRHLPRPVAPALVPRQDSGQCVFRAHARTLVTRNRAGQRRRHPAAAGLDSQPGPLLA